VQELQAQEVGAEATTTGEEEETDKEDEESEECEEDDEEGAGRTGVGLVRATTAGGGFARSCANLFQRVRS
jgi:hypothetical protein